MFEAFVLVCMISGDCIELKDKRGPYETLEQCKERIEEIVKDIPTLHIPQPIKDLYYKCPKQQANGINT